MNPATRALIWEMGRRHRWGWLLLAVLLALCTGGNFLVQHLDRRAQQMEDARRIEGSLTATQLLAATPAGGLEQGIRLSLNSKVIYDGPIQAGDVISWSGDDASLRLKLNDRRLFDGPYNPRQNWLSWSTPSRSGKVLLAANYDEDERIAALMGANEWRPIVRVWSVVFMGFSVLLLFVMFGDTEPQAGRGFTGMPPRRFTLPVPTITLVAWPVALGSLTIAALTIAWCRLVLSGLLPQGNPIPERYLTLELLAALTLFQAIVWGLPSFPKTRVALLSLLVYLLVIFTAYAFGNPHELLVGAQWGFAAAWLAGAAAAFFGVQCERQGRWTAWQRGARLAALLHRFSPRPLRLKTALGTQIWFEWKRNCRLSLVLWAVLVWAVLGVNWMQSLANGAVESGVILTFLGFCIFASLTGLNLGRDIASKELSLSSFTATRPVDTGMLVTAKLIAGLANWLAGGLVGVVCVLVGIALTGFIIDAAHPVPKEWSEIVFWLTGLVISLQLFVGILPLSLSGRIRGIPWSLLPMLLVIGGIGNGIGWLEHHGWPQDLMCSALAAMVTLKLVTAFWGFRKAMVARVASRTFVMVCVVTWLLATTVCLSVVVAFNPTNDGQVAVASALAALLAVPLARIAISPLALAWNRHR